MSRHAARPNEAGRKRKYERRPVDGKCPVTGKLRFATRAKARKELKRYVAAFAVRSVYECPHPSCGGWHLTKKRSGARG